MENKKKNRQKGITLIALVVTIVVLTILATVSINTVLGDNGIIARAEKAKEMTKEASKKEEVSLAVMNSYDDSGKIDHNQLKDNLNKIDGIKQITKIENEKEKEIENKVDALPIVIFTEDNKTIHIDENGNVAIKEMPKKDVDINGDGVINMVDANMIVYYATRKMSFTDEQKTKADINGDGDADAIDSTQLMRYIEGKEQNYI